jgi:hypothetical protein
MKNFSDSEKKRIQKNWNWSKNYWDRKSKQLNLTNWKFVMNHSKTSLGMCNYTQKKICISSYFLKGNNCNEQSMRNTILHECAHALAGHHNSHNDKWKKIAKHIGCNGEKYGIMERPRGNYLLFCPKGCFKQEYYRKPKIEGKVCLKCNSSPKLKKIENK